MFLLIVYYLILEYIQVSYQSGAEKRNRTPNLLITIQLLYQLSYFSMVAPIGFEPMMLESESRALPLGHGAITI